MMQHEHGYEDRIRRLVWTLNRVQAHGLAHYEDCKNAEYDDQNCSCGMEQAEKHVRMALEHELLHSNPESGK